MTEAEVLSASPQRLTQWADFLGLRPVGKRGTYWVRKSARHPLTKRDFILKQSMKTSDLRTAIIRAQPVVQAFLGNVQTTLAPMVSSTPKTNSTVGECLDTYEGWEHGQKQTRHRAVITLERILREQHPNVEDVRELDVAVVDGKLARLWLLKEEAAAAKEFLPRDREAFERRRRSRNQTLANAQMVFSARSRQRMRDLGLRVPDSVLSFVAELGLEAREAPPPEDFTPEELSAIRKGLPDLLKNDPASYAVVLLTLHAGLRNIECMAARWRWIGSVAGDTFIDLSTQGVFEPKGRDGWVLIDPALLIALPRRADPPAPDDYLVPAATETDRHNAVYRAVNAFLDGCGVRKINGKLAYRCRGHAITRIFLEHGPAAAKEFARHTSQSVTERYYIGAKAPYQPLSVTVA